MTTLQVTNDSISGYLNIFRKPHEFATDYIRSASRPFHYSNSSNVKTFKYQKSDYVKKISTKYSDIESIFNGMMDLSEDGLKKYTHAVEKMYVSTGISIHDL